MKQPFKRNVNDVIKAFRQIQFLYDQMFYHISLERTSFVVADVL